MKDKKPEIKDISQKHFDNPFKDMQQFSGEHIDITSRFERLLESMQQQDKSRSEARYIIEIKQKLDAFATYLEKTNSTLNNSEKNQIALITGARFSATTKKRMIEDLLHKIKHRIETDLEAMQIDDEFKADIENLHNNEKRIFNWFRLLKFSLTYNTITPFSHRLCDSTLTIIRENLFLWTNELIKNINSLLDKEYYLLSILEYNSLVTISQLNKTIDAIIKLPLASSYDPLAIAEVMDNFAKIYMIILKNAEISLKAFEKALTNKKTPHGLLGTLYCIIDHPLLNNKLLSWSPYDRITKSITGTLLSYYTCRRKCIISSINQIMFILNTDGKLPHDRKMLTDKAFEFEKTKNMDRSAEEEKLLTRYSELERIIDRFIINGKIIEEYFYQAETEYVSNLWTKESRKKPIFKIKRLIEGFIKYFIDFINPKRSLQVLYEGKEYNYFEYFPALGQAISTYNSHELGLIGTKVKEILNIPTPSGNDANNFIKNLMLSTNAKNEYGFNENYARETLLVLSEKTYLVTNQLNEIITSYYNNMTANNQDDIIKTYDFFTNGIIKKTTGMKTHLLFKRDSITLKEFLENACSVGYYILDLLAHSIIPVLITEKKEMQIKINQLMAVNTDDELNDLQQKVDSLYKDTLTGLNNREYFEDEIIPTYYDDNMLYKMDFDRYVFMGIIDRVQDYNEFYGDDVVDEIFKTVALVMQKHLQGPKTSKHNDIIKFDGGKIIGYINETSMSHAIELLDNINKELINTSFKDLVNSETVSLSFGLFKEPNNTNVNENLDIAQALMTEAHKKNGNNICFIKNPDLVIRKHDFSTKIGFNNTILSFLHKE